MRRGGQDRSDTCLYYIHQLRSKPASESADHLTTESGREPRPEFVDYLTGGCQISLAVGIDFTASNGRFQPLLFSSQHPDESDRN
jgi:hypothetical protein